MSILKIVLAIPVIVAIAIIIAIRKYFKKAEYNKDDRLISFKDFKSYYMINPDNWIISKQKYTKDNQVVYKPTNICFRFSVSDYYKFVEFRDKAPTKEYKEFLKSIEKDIEDFREKTAEEHEEQIQNAHKLQNDIVANREQQKVNYNQMMNNFANLNSKIVEDVKKTTDIDY